MAMSLEGLLVLLLVGGVAGWLAGLVLKGKGFGILVNIVIGILGAFIGNFVLGLVGVSIGSGIIGSIFNAFIGALLLLFLIGLIRKT